LVADSIGLGEDYTFNPTNTEHYLPSTNQSPINYINNIDSNLYNLVSKFDLLKNTLGVVFNESDGTATQQYSFGGLSKPDSIGESTTIESAIISLGNAMDNLDLVDSSSIESISNSLSSIPNIQSFIGADINVSTGVLSYPDETFTNISGTNLKDLILSVDSNITTSKSKIGVFQSSFFGSIVVDGETVPNTSFNPTLPYKTAGVGNDVKSLLEDLDARVYNLSTNSTSDNSISNLNDRIGFLDSILGVSWSLTDAVGVYGDLEVISTDFNTPGVTTSEMTLVDYTVNIGNVVKTNKSDISTLTSFLYGGVISMSELTFTEQNLTGKTNMYDAVQHIASIASTQVVTDLIYNDTELLHDAVGTEGDDGYIPAWTEYSYELEFRNEEYDNTSDATKTSSKITIDLTDHLTDNTLIKASNYISLVDRISLLEQNNEAVTAESIQTDIIKPLLAPTTSNIANLRDDLDAVNTKLDTQYKDTNEIIQEVIRGLGAVMRTNTEMLLGGIINLKNNKLDGDKLGELLNTPILNDDVISQLSKVLFDTTSLSNIGSTRLDDNSTIYSDANGLFEEPFKYTQITSVMNDEYSDDSETKYYKPITETEYNLFD
jgi:hypothetical protein